MKVKRVAGASLYLRDMPRSRMLNAQPAVFAVLTNLFRLDGTPRILGTGDELPSMSPNEKVQNVVFPQEVLNFLCKQIRCVRYENVSFTKSTIQQMTFTECEFEDCLFNGTRLDEVEFHRCRFKNCNFSKARFDRVYIDPDSISFDLRYTVEAANVGISTFQGLLANFANERQDEFFMRADIQFRRWKRYQIWWELRQKRISRAQAYWRWLSSKTYECCAGFGYNPSKFFLTTVILFFLISTLNYFLIKQGVVIGGAPATEASFVDTIFYTFSVMTVLGFSTVVPVSSSAKILAVFQALIAIGWLGIFTAVFVKRFLR